jgi:hypothetical protein
MSSIYINTHTPKGREVIRHHFTKDELVTMKDSLATNCIALQRKQDELDEIKDSFKLVMKPMEKTHKGLLTDINNGYVDQSMEVYYVPDYDRGIMEMYNEASEKVYERPLTVSERQQQIPFTQTQK